MRDSVWTIQVRRHLDTGGKRGERRRWLLTGLNILTRHLRCLRVVRGDRILLVVVRPVHADLPAHDLEVVQVSDCGGGGVCIGEVCEAITLWFPRLRVHHKTEFGNRASGAEDVFDLFLRKV